MPENNSFFVTPAMPRPGMPGYQSRPEQGAAFLKGEHHMTFEDTVARLRTGAELLLRGEGLLNEATLISIRGVLQERGGAQNITAEVCAEYVNKNSGFSLQPEMLRALADVMEEQNRTQGRLH